MAELDNGGANCAPLPFSYPALLHARCILMSQHLELTLLACLHSHIDSYLLSSLFPDFSWIDHSSV